MTNFMFAESAKRDVPLVKTTRLVSPPTIGLFGIIFSKLPLKTARNPKLGFFNFRNKTENAFQCITARFYYASR